MRFPALIIVGVIGLLPVLGACAQGAQLAPTGDDGRGGDGAGNSGPGGGDVGGGDVGGAGGGYGGEGVGGNGGAGAGSSSGGAGGAGASGGMGGAGGGGGSGGMGGNPCSFESPNMCSSAQQLPAVSGDEGGTQSATGSGSKWFKIHVEETSSSVFESDLKYAVTLSSPAGMNYDLFVREGPQDGSPNCNATEVKGTPSGANEVVFKSWDDDQGIGGEDDSVWLSIEVRHVSGMDCNAKWNLTVKGN